MRIIPLTILCALVGLTYWVGATAYTSRIQQDISTRTNEAIASYKPNVDLEVDGRDVTIRGKVRDENMRKAAFNTVDSVNGVRATRDQLSLMESYDLYGKFGNGNPASLKGRVDSDSHAALIGAFPNLKDKLTTDARSLTNGAGTIAIAATAINKMDQAEMWLNEDRLKITGVAPDEATRKAIEAYLQQQKGAIAPLRLITDITTPQVPAKCGALSDPDRIHQVLLFDVDSDIVKDIYHQPIQFFANLIEECTGAEDGKVIIEAHADHDGSEEYNFDLSRRRAEQVARLLESNGLNTPNVAAFAFGETRPVASNEINPDKSNNRRVEIRYIEAPKDAGNFNQTLISTKSAE